MSKKFNPEKLNLQHCVRYIIERSYSCDESGCDSEGICRCSVIDNVFVTEVHMFQIAEKIVNYLTFSKTHFGNMEEKFRDNVIEIMKRNGVDDFGNYSWTSCGDYYGEIVSGIYFNGMEKLLKEVKKVLYK